MNRQPIWIGLCCAIALYVIASVSVDGTGQRFDPAAPCAAVLIIGGLAAVRVSRGRPAVERIGWTIAAPLIAILLVFFAVVLLFIGVAIFDPSVLEGMGH